MKRMTEIENGTDAGMIPWDFVYELEGLAPDKVSPQLIKLDLALVGLVPEKWLDQRHRLLSVLAERKHVFLALSDMRETGQHIRVTGSLKSSSGEALTYHQVVFFDKDWIEDDYLACVVTDGTGSFECCFSKESFRDIPVLGEQMPDLLLKVTQWKETEFRGVAEIQVKPERVSKPDDNKVLIDLGIVRV